jgi:7-alpha-hydroxysteroid dehydrogenase
MILDRFRLTDRMAIVTGAGRGIGAATAVGLAEAGADVVISARTEEQLREVAAGSKGRDGGPWWSRRPERPRRRGRLASAGHRAFGRLDIVVNNVGGTMPRGFLETSPRFLEQAFHFNVSHGPRPDPGGRAPHAGRRAAERWSTSRRPWAGPRPGASWPTGRPRPPWPTTPGWRPPIWPPGSGSTPSPWDRSPPRPSTVVLTDDNLRTAMEEATPLKRIGDPEDIAAAIVYLCSPAGELRDGQGRRGRRWPRPPQSRHGHPRPVTDPGLTGEQTTEEGSGESPGGGVGNGERRPPRAGRHRRPARPRAGRGVGVEPTARWDATPGSWPGWGAPSG